MGVFKVNVYAVITQSSNHYGVGIVGPDNTGSVHFADGWIIPGALNVNTTEMISAREGLNKDIVLGWSRVIIETDAVKVIKATSDGDVSSAGAPLEDQIFFLCSRFHEVKILYCNRKANLVENDLARHSFRSCKHCVFHYAIPLVIAKSVIHDLRNL